MQRRLRLTGEKRFSMLHREGRTWVNRHLVLKALPNGLEDSRFGFAASKRVGKAVTRNLIKRRLRGAVQSTQVKPGWDVLVMARSAAAMADFHQLKKSLQGLLHRASLLAPAEARQSASSSTTGPHPTGNGPGPQERSEGC